MSRLPATPLYAWVGMLLLVCSSAACDEGVVELTLLSAGAGGADSDSQTDGRGSRGRTSGGSGEPRAGAGSDAPQFPYPCDLRLDEEQEQALLETLSEALSTGRYCPRTPKAQQRPLRVDEELQWQARFALCFPLSSRGWMPLTTRGVPMTWVLVDTPNLEDAKKALLGAEHQEVCNEAAENAFERIGVGNDRDDWVIFIAPRVPDDM